MWQLFSMVWSMAATVIIGCAMIALMVVNDFYTGTQMILTAVIGGLVALPISWWVAKKMYTMTQKPKDS